MAISVGQKAFASAANNPITGAITTQASGSSFLAITIYDGSFTSYTDSKSNTYSSVLAAASPSNFYTSTKIRVDLCTNGTGGSGHTLRANTSGAAAATVHLIEILGGVTASLVDKAIAAVEDSASPYTTGATGTLSQADELVIAAYLSDAPGGTETYTWGNSFTVVQSEGDSTNFWANTVGSLVVSATTSVTASLTKSTGVRAFGLIVSFKAGAAGGTTFTKVMSDTTSVTDTFNDPVRRVRRSDDTIAVSDAVVKSLVTGSGVFTKVMSDTLALTDEALDVSIRVRRSDDTIVVTEPNARRAFVMTRDDTLDVADSTVIYRRLVRRPEEALTLADAIIRSVVGTGIVYAKVLSDVVTLADDAGNRWALRVRQTSDTISPTDALIRTALRIRSLGDALTIDDGTVRVTRLKRVATDSLDIADELIRTLQLDQMSPTAFRFGVGAVPFRFGSGDYLPFNFGG